MRLNSGFLDDVAPHLDIGVEPVAEFFRGARFCLAAQIENAKRFFAALPDLKLTIEDRIIEGDKIVARCTYSGTQLGVFLGVPPTGKWITFGTIDIWRVEEGKFAEHWDQVDFVGVLKQLKAS